MLNDHDQQTLLLVWLHNHHSVQVKEISFSPSQGDHSVCTASREQKLFSQSYPGTSALPLLSHLAPHLLSKPLRCLSCTAVSCIHCWVLKHSWASAQHMGAGHQESVRMSTSARRTASSLDCKPFEDTDKKIPSDLGFFSFFFFRFRVLSGWYPYG